MSSPACPIPRGTDAGAHACAQLTTELGPVAESYDQLHRIDLLDQARTANGVARASRDSVVRAVFQAAQVCLFNLARLAARTQVAVVSEDFTGASRSVQWSVGFHRLLRRLGTAMFDARSMLGTGASAGAPTISISASAGYRNYLAGLEELEESFRTSVLMREPDTVRLTIATKSIDDSRYRVLHGIRLASHDATKWESDLTAIPVSSAHEADQFLSTDLLARAVAETELNAEVMHGEFVALHQIPEILCAEANDHLEAAVRAIRVSALSQAVQHLSVCRTLLEPMVEAQRVMAELLATAEYHEFRENLGPASGIHSLAIKQHMFRDLFKHFWNDLEAWLRSTEASTLEEAVRAVEARLHDDSQTWLRHSVIDEAFRLHSAHQQWRHEHLHMPRNCLGSGGTKSMIGVPDGRQTVYKMRDAANAQRSLRAIHMAREISLDNSVPDSPLVKLVSDPESVDSQIMRMVGEATREYFPQVQEQSYRPFRSGAAERKP